MKAVETSNAVHGALSSKHDELHQHIADGERLSIPKGPCLGLPGWVREQGMRAAMIALAADASFDAAWFHACAVEKERLNLEVSLKEKMEHVQVWLQCQNTHARAQRSALIMRRLPQSPIHLMHTRPPCRKLKKNTSSWST